MTPLTYLFIAFWTLHLGQFAVPNAFDQINTHRESALKPLRGADLSHGRPLPWNSHKLIRPMYPAHRPIYRNGDFAMIPDITGNPLPGDSVADEIKDDYRQGVADGRNAGRSEFQSQRGQISFRAAMEDGHRAFAGGEYGLAARHFLLAAILNQGDPTSRWCAAQAQMALGNFEDAARLIRRAFGLQPKLVHLTLDIRGAYRREEDFEKHVAILCRTADQNQDNSDLWFLVGFYHYYTYEFGKAATAFARAAELCPEDRLIVELRDLARMSCSDARN